MRSQPPHPARRRRGFTLVEMAIAALMIAGAMALTIQILAWTAAERRAAERRQRALQEVANLMEKVTSLPWDDLTPEKLQGARVSPSTLDALPGGELKVDVAPGPDTDSRRLTVALRWLDPYGMPVAPVRLVGYVCKKEGRRP